MFGWLGRLFPPLKDKQSLATELRYLENVASALKGYAGDLAFTLANNEFDDIADRRIRHALQELLQQHGKSTREFVRALSDIDSYARQARKGRLYSGPPRPGLKGGG